jgi:gamma-glutamyltranspeptidase/glutathione hydrolase
MDYTAPLYNTYQMNESPVPSPRYRAIFIHPFYGSLPFIYQPDMRKLFLYSLLCWASITQAQIPNYIPFPYKTPKEVIGDSAMVVSAHPLATMVGVDILRKGGNAVDAAIAVHFALSVVYPQAGNIGGGGFMIYRDKSNAIATLDFREKAPAAAFKDMYLDSLGNAKVDKSRIGALACGVPGSVDGMWEAHQKYGKLSWGELINPAIELAEKGFQITQQEADNLNREKFTFVKNSGIMPAFVKMESWEPKHWLIQKDLAETLKRIAGEGRKGFYEGATAALIANHMEQKKGIITQEDLKNYHSVWRKPLEFDYKDLHIITMAPPSSGGIILQQLLGMIRDYPVKSYGFHSAAATHLMAEAERRAFADRAVHMADPDFYQVPVAQLTDSAYLKLRMSNFKPDTTTMSGLVRAGKFKESEETTHLCIVDHEGNAVSITTTLNDSYGSRSVVAGAGFILNNEMDDFSIKPGVANIYETIGGKANAIEPNKRPLSSMTPIIVTKNNKTWLIAGTPGGTTIPTSMFQLLVNLSEFDMSLTDAIQSKRFHHQWKPDKIQYEEGAFTEDVLLALTKKGHQMTTRNPIGRIEGIIRLKDGNWQGVADHRGDDTAGGF